jgi:hypothetical protein
LKNAFYTIDRKLLMLGNITPIHVNAFGSVYEKIGIGEGVQVYHKQVWISQFGSYSLFDYGFKNLKITESRTTSESEVTSTLPHILLHASKPVVQRVLSMVKENGIDKHKLPFELKKTHTSDWRQAVQGYDPSGMRDMTAHFHDGGVKHEWVNVWHDVYGNNAVAIGADQLQYDNVRDAGKQPIVVVEGWLGICRILGIPTHKDVLSADQLDGRKMLGDMTGIHVTWKQLEKAGLTAGMNQPVVTLYTEPIAEAKQGFVRNRQVFLNQAVVGSEQENLVMVEQFAKYISDSSDRTSKLQGWLVTALTGAIEN